jgi:hypothetical protein
MGIYNSVLQEYALHACYSTVTGPKPSSRPYLRESSDFIVGMTGFHSGLFYGRINGNVFNIVFTYYLSNGYFQFVNYENASLTNKTNCFYGFVSIKNGNIGVCTDDGACVVELFNFSDARKDGGLDG